MLKKFLKDSSIYSISQLLTRGMALIMVPFYTRVLTPADYGIIDILAVMAMIAGTLFPLEITQGVARFYPDAPDKRTAQAIGSSALFFTLLMLGLFLLLVQIFEGPIGNWLFESSDRHNLQIVRAAGVSIFMTKMFYVVQCQLQWRLEPQKHAASSIVFSIISLSLNIVFILYLGTGVIGVFYAQSIAGAAGFLLAFYFGRDSYALVFDLPVFRKMLAFSVPLVPSGIGLFLLTYVDRLFIKEMMTLADLGLFGIGFRVASVVGVVMAGMTSALTPLIYSALNDEQTPGQLAKIFRIFTAGAILMTAGISIFAREILAVLTTPGYYGAIVVIPSLVLSTFLSRMYIFTPGLAIAKKTGYLALINLVGGALNILLNYMLLTWLGILGAALATLLSYLLIFVVKMHFSQKFYYVPHHFSLLIRSLLVSMVPVAAGYYLNSGSVLQDITFKMMLFSSVPLLLVQNKLLETAELKHYALQIKQKLGK